MMPQDSTYGGWPTSGEIDVFEGKGQDTGWASSPCTRVLRGIRTTCRRHVRQSGLRPPGFTTTDWHTYDLKWEDGPGNAAGTMTFYIDGVAYHTRTGGWTTPAGQPASAPFDQPFFIIMNLAVSGNFVGGAEPGAGTYDMQVDYVRTYASSLAPTWKSDVAGSWNDPSKWTDSIIPNALDADVLFGNVITQAHTADPGGTGERREADVRQRSPLHARRHADDHAEHEQRTATIDVLSGSHTISAPVSLQKSTSVHIAPAASMLTMSGDLHMADNTTLTKLGDGALEVQSLRSRGGGVSVTAGTLRAAGLGTRRRQQCRDDFHLGWRYAGPE